MPDVTPVVGGLNNEQVVPPVEQKPVEVDLVKLAEETIARELQAFKVFAIYEHLKVIKDLEDGIAFRKGDIERIKGLTKISS